MPEISKITRKCYLRKWAPKFATAVLGRTVWTFLNRALGGWGWVKLFLGKWSCSTTPALRREYRIIVTTDAQKGICAWRQTLTDVSLLRAQASARGVIPTCCSLASSENSSFATSPVASDRSSWTHHKRFAQLNCVSLTKQDDKNAQCTKSID